MKFPAWNATRSGWALLVNKNRFSIRIDTLLKRLTFVLRFLGRIPRSPRSFRCRVHLHDSIEQSNRTWNWATSHPANIIDVDSFGVDNAGTLSVGFCPRRLSFIGGLGEVSLWPYVDISFSIFNIVITTSKHLPLLLDSTSCTGRELAGAAIKIKINYPYQ